MIGAWHTAALYRAKKLPKLESMLSSAKVRKHAARPKQTLDEQMVAMTVWQIALQRRR